MALFVGLTDDLLRRKEEHGTPSDWRAFGPFATEVSARAWERYLLTTGYQGGPGGSGWRYGYTYTITGVTKQ